jgi:methyltransferase
MLIVVFIAIAVPMLIEARRAAANERAQRARGGLEPAADVSIYKVMSVAYPGAFAAMLGEAAFRGSPGTAAVLAGATVFACAKALKWWAILSLGPVWTFRVIVVPGAPLVRRGPYRRLRHPNYVGVVGELVGAALMTGALVTGPLAIVGFGILLRNRIRVEDRALTAELRPPTCSL